MLGQCSGPVGVSEALPRLPPRAIEDLRRRPDPVGAGVGAELRDERLDGLVNGVLELRLRLPRGVVATGAFDLVRPLGDAVKTWPEQGISMRKLTVSLAEPENDGIREGVEAKKDAGA